MRPITFSCTETVGLTPGEIAGRILDVANWTDFKGYGPLPGVRSVEFQVRTSEVVGSRVAVTNTDGSRHVEEIIEWRPGERVRLKLKEFSPPLSRLALAFEETWAFRATPGGTEVVRSVDLLPRSVLARPALWVISLLLRQAVARHLRQLRDGAPR